MPLIEIYINKSYKDQHLVRFFGLCIASRQYQYYPIYDYQAREITEQNMEERTKSRKRKQTCSSETSGKVMKLDTDTHQSSIPERTTGRKSKKLVSSAIASINKLCDCRRCYEKHILKMWAGPWWGCA